MQVLPDRVPWYVVGPVLGLLVVLLYALTNKRLGVSGSYTQVRQLVLGRPVAEPWRVWFFAGIVAGSALVAVLRGGPVVSFEYGRLGEITPLAALVPVLLAGGALIGYGARWAEGCTSGHGISGFASRSPASWAASVTFWLTALGVTFALNFLSGGAL